MRIICENTETLQPYIATLQYCGYKTCLWNVNKKPLLDIYDEVGPSLILHSSQSTERICNSTGLSVNRVQHISADHYSANPAQLLGKAEDKYKCDVLIMDRALPPITKEIGDALFDAGFKVKIFAEMPTGSPFQLGALTSYKEIGTALASSSFLIDLTNRWGLNAAMNGSLSFKKSEENSENDLDGARLAVYNSVDNLVQEVQYWNDNEREFKKEMVERRYDVKNSNYFYNVSNMFDELGLFEEGSKVEEIFKEKVLKLI